MGSYNRKKVERLIKKMEAGKITEKEACRQSD